MKAKKRLLLPILSLASLLAIGVGTTYALFTNNAETNISVKAGKVNVQTEISEFKTYSGSDNLTGIPEDDEQYIVETTTPGVFTNGGTATYDNTTGNIDLNNLTPGDRVSFNLIVKNYSNVAIKYRPMYEITGNNGLANGLVVEIDGVVYSEDKQIANWTDANIPETEGETIRTIAVVIDFPTSRNNIYQNSDCELAFIVEAVQGNAKVTNPHEKIKDWWDFDNDSVQYGQVHRIDFKKNGEYTPNADSISWDCPCNVTAYLDSISEDTFLLTYVAPGDKIILTDDTHWIFGMRNEDPRFQRIVDEEGLWQKEWWALSGEVYCSRYSEDWLHMSITEICSTIWTLFDDESEAQFAAYEAKYFYDSRYSICFEGFSCSEINGLNILDFSHVTDLSNFFSNCKSLTSIDLSFLDTINVLNMNCMFSDCVNLITIYASESFVTTNVVKEDESSSHQMFSRCNNLVGGNGTPYNSEFQSLSYAKIDKEGQPGYFTLKD